MKSYLVLVRYADLEGAVYTSEDVVDAGDEREAEWIAEQQYAAVISNIVLDVTCLHRNYSPEEAHEECA